MVSVIVPAYNAQETLEACLRSILGQSYPALEVLVVDDGSRDDTPAILARIAGEDSRVVPIRQANAGVAVARNTALERATGEYVQFCDSDDELMPDSTRALVTAAVENECQLVIGPFYEVLPTVCKLRGFYQADEAIPQTEALHRLSQHPNSFFWGVLWNKLYRRDLIREHEVVCDRLLPWGEDFAFNMDYMAHALRVAFVGAPVYRYYRSLNGLAASSLYLSVRRPFYSIGLKVRLYRRYKKLYCVTGLYGAYRWQLPSYLFKTTINN